ncbi:DUF3718 domain-containing protein [Paraglaciecola sp. 2405UD69-4]|uniref:DUF3718 domain-containing protein n=1 Tax=Paraglaciecola sp. 2405UD69-4 TaxID=3391836 RepID=UPI0039C97993
MNTFTKIIATSVLTISSIGMANAATEYVAADDYVTSKLCVTATEGSKLQLAKAIEKTGLSKRYVVKNVTCNNQDIITFVEQHGTNVDNINNYLTAGKYSNNVEVTTVASR